MPEIINDSVIVDPKAPEQKVEVNMPTVVVQVAEALRNMYTIGDLKPTLADVIVRGILRLEGEVREQGKHRELLKHVLEQATSDAGVPTKGISEDFRTRD